MIDFKKLTEERRMRTGYCSLQPKHYATVSAKRTSCTTGIETDEQIPWIIEEYPGTNEMTFRLLRGSTGWEAWHIKSLLENPCSEWWAACLGTPGRWDTLMVNGAEVLEILRGCGYA